MSWTIDDADTERGVPEAAHCDSCGTVWRRPEGDEWADTLPDLARTHRCETSQLAGSREKN